MSAPRVLLSRWCLERSVPRFLFASSMTVYGHGNREPVPENAPCVPISYYGASKLACENYLRLAAQEGLSVTCMRFYNVYGRGQNIGNIYQGMVSIYLAYLLKRVTVPVTGSLDRYRDFVHVDDVVDVLMRALDTAAAAVRRFQHRHRNQNDRARAVGQACRRHGVAARSSDRRVRRISERRFRFGRRYSPRIGAARLEAARSAR